MVGAVAVYAWQPLRIGVACPLRTITGVPCPFCGMTRAVVAAVRGDLGASLHFHPLGIAIVLVAIAALVLPRRVASIRVSMPVVLALVAASWIWNVALNPTFH